MSAKEELHKLAAELEAARKELAEVKTKKASRVSMKVSQKGAVSVYGLGRFPVTLYAGQWESLLGKADEIMEFIRVNEEDLSRK